MKILGIESSCDETAASVVEDGHKMLSNSIASSVDLHAAYGGVVPEIAARSHLEVIIPTIKDALKTAKIDWSEIDAIAVTYGPGLSGSLLIGVMTARTLAITEDKPLYAINHVEAHPYATFINKASSSLSASYHLPTTKPEFPILALIISGGHTQLVLFENHAKYKVLGQTADDAVGEAFDKVAKLLGLPFPGGPSITKAAQAGDPQAVRMPIPKTAGQYDFSYSGLKTAVLRATQQMVGVGFDFPSFKLSERLSVAQKANIAASFEATAIEVLAAKTFKAFEAYKPKSLVVAGGVAANTALRARFKEQFSLPVIYPDIKLCTDNAAMIAALAFYRIQVGDKLADSFKLSPIPSLEM